MHLRSAGRPQKLQPAGERIHLWTTKYGHVLAVMHGGAKQPMGSKPRGEGGATWESLTDDDSTKSCSVQHSA